MSLKKPIFVRSQQAHPTIMAHYSKDTIDKIGNAIIYLSQRTTYLNKTKLLKLLYLLEENSAKKYSTPFFGIQFNTWRFGPVAGEVFADLTNDFGGPEMFKDYVTVRATSKGTYIKGKGEFNDDEFSDNDIDVMDCVIKEHGHKSAEELVNELHKSGSAWDISAKKCGLHELFEAGLITSSDIPVDITISLPKDAKKRYDYTFKAWEEMSNFKK